MNYLQLSQGEGTEVFQQCDSIHCGTGKGYSWMDWQKEERLLEIQRSEHRQKWWTRRWWWWQWWLWIYRVTHLTYWLSSDFLKKCAPSGGVELDLYRLSLGSLSRVVWRWSLVHYFPSSFLSQQLSPLLPGEWVCVCVVCVCAGVKICVAVHVCIQYVQCTCTMHKPLHTHHNRSYDLAHH